MSTEPQPQPGSPVKASQPLDAGRLPPAEHGGEGNYGSEPQSPIDASQALAADRLAAHRASPQAGAAALKAAREAGAHLRRDFAPEDQRRWQELARKRGLTLPQWHEPASPSKIRRWLHKLGVSVESYKEWVGYKTLDEFAARNPRIGARPWLGYLLEALEDGQLSSEPGPSPRAGTAAVELGDAASDSAEAEDDDAATEQATGIVCKGCGCDSGARGSDRFGAQVQAQLRPKGWLILHGGHLGMQGDGRCWTCPRCAEGWRGGQALRDVARIHGGTQPSSRPERDEDNPAAR